MYQFPNKNDPVELTAHILSEMYNDSAPMGWERYFTSAKVIIDDLEKLQGFKIKQTTGE